MATVNFYLKEPKSAKPTLIYMFVHVGLDKPIKYSVGDKVHPSDWSSEKMRIREKRTVFDVLQRNVYLDKLEAAARTIYKTFLNDGRQITKQAFHDELDYFTGRKQPTRKLSFLEYLRVYVTARTEDRATDAKILAMLQKNILAYVQQKKAKVEWEDLTLTFKDRFQAFLEDQNYKKNSISTIFGVLKPMIDKGFQDGHHTNTIFRSRAFSASREAIKRHSLSLEELQQIYECDLSGFTKSVGYVRDAFILSAFSLMRFSDYSALTKENIQGNMIHRKTKKTGKHVVIPIHHMVQEILNKYGGELPPSCCNVTSNRHLKKILEVAGITKSVVISYTKGGQRVDEIVEKWKTATTHMGRRSGATNMIKQGFNRERVKMLTGHASDASFDRYVDLDEEENAEILAGHDYFKKPE